MNLDKVGVMLPVATRGKQCHSYLSAVVVVLHWAINAPQSAKSLYSVCLLMSL